MVASLIPMVDYAVGVNHFKVLYKRVCYVP